MKIIIIDDDKLVCSSLKTILSSKGIHVCATGNNGAEAIKLYEQHRPDILLMDIRMETINGVDASKQILSSFPQARILFLTTFRDDEYIIKALQMGVKGYILKQNYDCILPALEAVYMGQNVFNTEIITRIPDLWRQKESFPIDNLNSREMEITILVAKGLNNKEIAESLFLSEGTVRNYLSIILDKLELRDRTQLAVYYYQHRPIDPK